MKALIRASTLDESVGIVGTYWNDGSRNADTGGVDSVGCGGSSVPDLALGIDR